MLAAIAGVLAVCAPAAHAVFPIGPADNATGTSTQTFAWLLAPGEEAFAIELSPNGALGQAGSFADDVRKRSVVLAPTQTSYTVGNQNPLPPGTWFWHVNSFTPTSEGLWSPTRRLVVPDDPIRLRSFEFTNLRCIRKFKVEFAYSDNSAGRPASFRVEFRRKKRGRLLAAAAGRARDGQHVEILRLPRKVRRGRHYVRLRLRDGGGHVDRSGYRRMRADRC